MSSLRKIAGLLPPVAFVATLMLPMVQTLWPFAPIRGLGGTVDPEPEDVPFDLQSWHSGALQQRIESRLVKVLGLRDWMVRLDNEIKFSLFGVAKRSVMGGRDGWLYGEDYQTANGHLTPGWSQLMMERVWVLWRAQQVLAENGVTLVLLLTPSKNETYPEHLPFPDDAVRAAGHPHFLGLIQAVFELGCLNHLDAQRLFTEWRRQDPAARLFHQNGVHWSDAGTARVVVHLLDYLARVAGVDLVNADFAGVEMADVPADNDLLNLANLLWVDRRASEAGDIGRGILRPRAGDAGTKQGVLLVTTSFGWLLLRNLRELDVCEPLTMHYYFKTAYDVVDKQMSEKRPVDPSPAALRAEILRHRFVVVEWNAAKFLNLFGFPEAVLAAFGAPAQAAPPPIPPERLEALQRAMTETTPR